VSRFSDYPAIPKELDLFWLKSQITCVFGLDDVVDREETLDTFHFDDHFEENENNWCERKKEISVREAEKDRKDAKLATT
jgi:hypothetical protein